MSAAAGAARAALAARINHQLDALAAGGGSREVADLLHHLLESGQLAGLVDAAGRSCRASATEALTRLGFPFALEVRPEDLDHLRGLDADAPGFRWAPLAAGGTLGAGIVAQWVLLLERGMPGSGDLQPLVLLMGLSLMALLTGVFNTQALGGPGLVTDWVTATVGSNAIGAQVWIQLKAVLLTLVWSGVVSLVAYKIVDLVIGLRVPEDEEREGLDITSHGETAYHN